ncbi:MAG: hypothetical protein Q7U76_14800 [Nitrospirota bacterium]|nr:hypothetical protein [Nitrospirota bacterium]
MGSASNTEKNGGNIAGRKKEWQQIRIHEGGVEAAQRGNGATIRVKGDRSVRVRRECNRRSR